MKYKVGDKVILENEQQLRDAGCSPEDARRLRNKFGTIAEVIDDGRIYRILIDHEKFEPNEFVVVSDLCIGMKVNDEEHKDTYTFDELQHKVDEFKKYLAEVNNRNQCLIDVYFNTIDSCEMAINSEVSIKK